MRLTRKPGHSATRTGVLPMRATSSMAACVASGAVSWPAITSTRRMTLAGLKKCSPSTRSGRSVDRPIWVIDRPDVLEARMASSRATASRRANTARLTSITSVVASMMRSQSARASSSSAAVMRERIASASSGCSRPRATRRSPMARTWSSPRSSAAASTSRSVTARPAAAATWAISLPITPAPTTPIRCASTLAPSAVSIPRVACHAAAHGAPCARVRPAGPRPRAVVGSLSGHSSLQGGG